MSDWLALVRKIAASIVDDDPVGDQYCPECSFIGEDADAVTEHVFAAHPEAVAR